MSQSHVPIGVRMRLLFYNALFPFALLWMLPALALRIIRRGNYRRKFGQRFGLYDPQVRARLKSREWTWIHSISVGETVLALKLARKMKALDPALNIVLSATTSTGFALAEEAAQAEQAATNRSQPASGERTDWLEILYNPLDAPFIVRCALSLVRPRRLVFIEAIWPNLLAQAKQRAVSTALIARLSPRSEARFRRFRFLTGPIFRLLDAICVQEREDIARWTSLGADAAQIQVTGNIKFDYTPAPSKRVEEFRAFLRALGVKPDAPILLAGSTFPGEERILAKVFRKLREQFPELFLIIVPRHVERTDQVVADVIASGLSVALRSATPGIRTAEPADCLIVNTTGELRDWYYVATVVFIGKSLTSTGGQNPVEAVAAGKPVIFGPHMENFRAIVARWLAHAAAIEITDPTSLERTVAKLLRDKTLRDTLAHRAREIAAAHEGATERTARLLLSF
jgi:3-deoxy-D-manno-octulosonic-acid transferase